MSGGGVPPVSVAISPKDPDVSCAGLAASVAISLAPGNGALHLTQYNVSSGFRWPQRGQAIAEFIAFEPQSTSLTSAMLLYTIRERKPDKTDKYHFDFTLRRS